MPPLTDRRAEAVDRYLKLKEAGTVLSICQEFQISKPTLLKWVEDHLKEKEGPDSEQSRAEAPTADIEDAAEPTPLCPMPEAVGTAREEEA